MIVTTYRVSAERFARYNTLIVGKWKFIILNIIITNKKSQLFHMHKFCRLSIVQMHKSEFFVDIVFCKYYSVSAKNVYKRHFQSVSNI